MAYHNPARIIKRDKCAGKISSVTGFKVAELPPPSFTTHDSQIFGPQRPSPPITSRHDNHARWVPPEMSQRDMLMAGGPNPKRRKKTNKFRFGARLRRLDTWNGVAFPRSPHTPYRRAYSLFQPTICENLTGRRGQQKCSMNH